MLSQSIEKFKAYLENQNDSFLQDGKRIEGIIRDIFPEEKSFIFPLTCAWKAGVVTELSQTTNFEVAIAQFGDRLCQEFGLNESSALSAVRVWAYALRVTDVVPNIHISSTSSSVNQVISPSGTKKCPFCAEEVKKDARKCKHCHSDISDNVVVGGSLPSEGFVAQSDRLTAEDWYEKGKLQGKAGNYNEAIESYNNAIRLKPDYIYAFMQRGFLYSVLKNFEQAISDFSKTVEIDPAYAPGYKYRAWEYKELGLIQQYLDDYNMAAQLGDEECSKILKEYDVAIIDAQSGIKKAQEFLKEMGIGYANLVEKPQLLITFNEADISIDINKLTAAPSGEIKNIGLVPITELGIQHFLFDLTQDTTIESKEEWLVEKNLLNGAKKKILNPGESVPFETFFSTDLAGRRGFKSKASEFTFKFSILSIGPVYKYVINEVKAKMPVTNTLKDDPKKQIQNLKGDIARTKPFVEQKEVNGIIVWKGTWFLMDATTEIILDGALIGKDSIKKGFQIPFTITTGTHILTLKLPLGKKKECPLSFNVQGTYLVTAQFSKMLGNWGEISITKNQ